MGKGSSRQKGCRSSSSLRECWAHADFKVVSWTLWHQSSTVATNTGRKSPGTNNPGHDPAHPDPRSGGVAAFPPGSGVPWIRERFGSSVCRRPGQPGACGDRQGSIGSGGGLAPRCWKEARGEKIFQVLSNPNPNSVTHPPLVSLETHPGVGHGAGNMSGLASWGYRGEISPPLASAGDQTLRPDPVSHLLG